MSISFGTSVAVNNLLALRAFYTFLFNYNLHEKPYWFERVWITPLKMWVERKAILTMRELSKDVGAKNASLRLADVSGDFFAILYLVQHPEVEWSTGQELFMVLAHHGLEFEKLKRPKADTGYLPKENI